MKSLFLKTFLIIICSFLNINFAVCQNNKAKEEDIGFNIVVIGDMPYFLPQDYTRFENVIRFLNTQDEVFNIFIGDIKSSKTDCSDDVYIKMYNYFEQFKEPLIYTPGDNEWTDCNVKGTDVFDPEERLIFLRKIFFKDTMSLGVTKIKLTSQSGYAGYEKFVENNRWNYKGVSFATIHVVGSNNNFNSESKNYNKEFFERNQADLFWLKEVFKKAKEDESLGIVLFVHADMFFPDKGGSGFTAFLKELKSLTKEFTKPVLLVNGDSHKFVVDKPLFNDDAGKQALLNFTRVQVFGEYDMHAVKIKINPSNPSLYEIQELLIPENK